MSEIKTNKLTGVGTAGSIAVTGEGNSTTTNLQQGLAKAWLLVNSSSVLSDSFNISGVTDNQTGDNTYALTNSMGNTQFSVTAIAADNNGEICHNNGRSSGSFDVKVRDGGDGVTLVDRSSSASMHGDLA